jgi:hypothetical protein
MPCRAWDTSDSERNYNERIYALELDLGVMAICVDCGVAKPRSAFHDNHRRTNGHQQYCKACVVAHTRISRGVHRDDAYLVCPPEHRCDICGGIGGKRGLYLDHDHSTGRFRGWLCNGCNSAIGHLADDPAIAVAAATYLRMAANPSTTRTETTFTAGDPMDKAS